ncbi:hypothetical protein [Peptostreptococcus sp. D1]|uniref:hypothetical protein n=1 Tax=Peptostreptococcus sp. D1 TaxID=72304 RepID=UPI0008F318FE|nr:hypothetical protein [Peptostreptococcus sp. D1]SFE18411.1 hypothetical protein SAMN02910278_00167 [Peptostreptococcus sp. D1]
MLGDVVRYNFFALDNVDKDTYSLDYAIVLDIDEKNNTTKILPISNKFHKESIESFCIGYIPGFVEVKNEGYVNNKQYVHFNKVIDVNDNELYPVHEQDLCGNISKDDSGSPINVALDIEQLEKIVKKYRIYEIGEEKNLINLLMKSDAHYELSNDTDIEKLQKISSLKMEKYREYNFNNNKIIVFFVDGKRYSVKLTKTDNLDLNSRNNRLKTILN